MIQDELFLIKKEITHHICLKKLGQLVKTWNNVYDLAQ